MKKRTAIGEHAIGQASARKSRVRADVANYDGMDFGRDELYGIMRTTYDELINFVTTPAFKAFHKELMGLLPKKRPSFVAKVLFDPDERIKRGIVVPNRIVIQTSAFGDRRPTLFGEKFLPRKYQKVWENLNLTFDNEYKNNKVSRASKKAWRPPLPVTLQNALIAAGTDLESVPVEQGVKFGMYAPARRGDIKRSAV